MWNSFGTFGNLDVEYFNDMGSMSFLGMAKSLPNL